MRAQLDPHRLHHGPYTLPSLRRGDRATCLYCDGDVVITSWSDGRISWPRCRRLDTRGGSGLLVDEELARAVRLESSLAIQRWWGVTEHTVWMWRQALGVERYNDGSARLRNDLNIELGRALKGKRLPPEQVERRRQTAKELGLRPVQRPGGRPWTAKELRLLGTMPDDELAARIGRTERAVRVMRLRHGIPVAKDRRRREHHVGGRTWTDSELALLGTVPDSELAARIGRTQGAIEVMRARLGVTTAKDRRAGRKMPSRRAR